MNLIWNAVSLAIFHNFNILSKQTPFRHDLSNNCRSNRTSVQPDTHLKTLIRQVRNFKVTNVAISNSKCELSYFRSVEIVLSWAARNSEIRIADRFDFLAVKLGNRLVEEFEKLADHLHYLCRRASFSERCESTNIRKIKRHVFMMPRKCVCSVSVFHLFNNWPRQKSFIRLYLIFTVKIIIKTLRRS